MADTIITNSPEKGGGDGSAGWVVALVIIIAVVVGGVWLYRSGALNGGTSDTNINVTLPNPVSPTNE